MICVDCRYWSEMLAGSTPDGDSVHAMCLCEDSPKYQKYTVGRQGCGVGETNLFGAIDAPGNENAYMPRP